MRMFLPIHDSYQLALFRQRCFDEINEDSLDCAANTQTSKKMIKYDDFGLVIQLRTLPQKWHKILKMRAACLPCYQGLPKTMSVLDHHG